MCFILISTLFIEFFVELEFKKKLDKKIVSYIPPPPPDDEDSIFESIEKGINFSRYDEISVECTGNDPPRKGIVR